MPVSEVGVLQATYGCAPPLDQRFAADDRWFAATGTAGGRRRPPDHHQTVESRFSISSMGFV